MSNACLTKWMQPDSKLPPAVIESVKKGKTALLERHIQQLQEEQAGYKQKYDDAKAAAVKALTEASVPYKYTNRPDDPNNELNQFEPVGLKKLLKNIVQRVGSVTNALKSALLYENGITAEETASIKYFNDTFNKPFQQSIERIYDPKAKQTKDRYKDMMRYLPFRNPDNPAEVAAITYEGSTYTSKLDVPTKTAMAATIYEWLHTDGGKATGQTPESLRALMGYAKDEQMPEDLEGHLMELGVNAEALAKQLGLKIAQRMGIKETMDSDMNAQARFEMALGFMAIAAMENMTTPEGKTYFIRQEVYTGYEGNGKGIQALKDGAYLDEEDVFYNPSPEERAFNNDPNNAGMKGKTTAKFLKLLSDTKYGTPTHMKAGEEHVRNSPFAFDKLFDNESDEINFSWSKIFLPKNAKVGRSGIVAAKQTANLQKNVDVTYDQSEHSMNAFLALGEGKAFDTIIGMVDDTNLLNIRNKSVEGSNRGIQRDLTNLKAWLELAKIRKAKGESSLFYIAAKFMNNMRMIQIGNLNPQNSKMHRNLFTPSSWRTEFNPKTDTATNDAFRQAVALAFDIESGKVGGKDTQLDKLDAVLAKPEIAKALAALKEYHSTGVMSETHKDSIAAAVASFKKVGGDRLHSFKGLVEYARYEAHNASADPNKGLFSTDMYNEIDGVSNGPIIGIMMLIPDSADKQAVLASLAMGGMSVDRNPNAPNLDKLLGQYNLNDAYQRMAQQWALNIAKMKLKLRTDSRDAKIDIEARNKFKKQYNYSMALETLLGRFTENKDGTNDGIINSLIRKLAKPRTMQTMYSAGITRQNMILSGDNVISDGIYGGIEKVLQDMSDGKAKDEVEAAFKKILKSVAMLTDKVDHNKLPQSSDISLDKYMTNGELDRHKIKGQIAADGTVTHKGYQLTKDEIKAITKATRQTYGQAMEEAIDTVYAPVIEARKPFNTLIQRQATIYNLVLKSKVDAQIAINDAATTTYNYQRPQDKGRITKAQLETILQSIEHLVPKIKTPNHIEGDPDNASYLTLAEVGRQKNAEGKKSKDYDDMTNGVIQSYTVESGLSPYKGHVDSIPYLKEVGASAMVRSIQMIDSMVANHLMGLKGVDILNAHDGFPHSIKDSEAVRDSANQRFFDVVSQYSLGQAMFDMHTDTAAKQTLEQAILANGINQADLIEALFKDNVVNFDTYEVSKEDLRNEMNYRQGKAEEVGRKFDYKKAKQTYLEEVSGIRPTNTVEQNKQAINKLFKKITSQAESMAAQVTRNKQEVTDNITQSAQYPLNGIGVTVTPAGAATNLFVRGNYKGVNPNNVLKVDATRTEKSITTLKALIQEKVFASSADNVSTNENDYPNPENVDSQNVVDKFDSILALDAQAAHASVQNSPEHIADLKRILQNIVARVMTPVEMFIAEHKSLLEDTRGLYKLGEDGNKIYIQRQNLGSSPDPGMLTQGIRMSAAEVYAHELIHHITHFGLKNDTTLRNQASTLYDLAFTEFTKAYGNEAYRVFMNDANAGYAAPVSDAEKQAAEARWTAVLNDPAMADERIAAQARWAYVFNPDQRADKSYAALDEFLTHGMTNENFKRELNKLSIDPSILKSRKAIWGIFEKNIQTTIVNLFNRIMDFVNTTFYSQRHSSNVAQELEYLVEALSKIESRQANVLTQAVGNAEAKLTALGVNMDERIKERVVKTMSTTAIGKMRAELKKLPELDNYLRHQVRLAMLWYNDQEQGLIASLVTEMTGSTERFQPLYDLLGKRKLVIDQAKNNVAEVERDVQNNMFERKLESHEKSSVTKVFLKGDISFLLNKNSLQAIQGFLDDKKKRQAEVNRLLAEVSKVVLTITKSPKQLREYMNFFQGGIDNLAYGMITSRSFAEGTNYRNANNLALMHRTGYDNTITGAAFEQIVELLDRAASVKSIDYMRVEDRKTASRLMTEDVSAVENILTSHNLLKQQLFEDLFQSNPALMEKGYTKTILNGRIQMEFGTIDDEQRLADQGFKRNGLIPRDPQDPVQDKIYIYTNVGGGTINDLQEGIVSFTANKTKGANSYDMEHQIGNTVNPEFVADVNNKKVLDVLDVKIKNMLKSTVRTTGIELSESYMTPKFNNQGQITSMRYIMSEFAKDTYLQQFSEFDSVLAAMASARVDKLATPEINKEVVVALKDMWDKDRVTYAGGFVSISPKSEHKRYRDIYNMFPPHMKKHILSYWGKNEIMVPQEMVDLVFGQRKYSILEMFGKTKEERNVAETLIVEGMQFALGFSNPFMAKEDEIQSRIGRTANRAKTVEDFLIQLTKLAKGNIIVRNFFVTWGNHVSNVMYLKSKGIPFKTIIPLQREAISSALRYQSDNSKLQGLLIKRDIIQNKQSMSAADRSVMVTNMTREIKRLENEIAINPSTAMIESGLLPSIVDDVDTGHVQSPYKFGLNKGIDVGLGKLPAWAEKAGRTVFMTEDTEGYRMLNNAVKMTDYVGRYVLYHHYTKTGMAHAEAVRAVTDEFIDFAPPTHRMIEYANNIGLMWFTKYQLRVLKHIKNVVADHPFSTLATFIIGQQLGNQNIINSIPGVTKGMLAFMGNPMSALLSGGPKILYVNGLEHVGSLLTGD